MTTDLELTDDKKECRFGFRRGARWCFLPATAISAMAIYVTAVPLAAQEPLPSNELLVNTTTAGVQRHPAVTTFRLTGSGVDFFFAVWNDARTADIKGQIFTAKGEKVRDEFVVNTPAPTETGRDRNRPTVTNTGRGPVVAWIEQPINPPSDIRRHVKLQRFNREGQKIGAEIQVNTADIDPNYRPAITSMIDGGFVVIWVGPRADQRVRAQRFHLEGSKAGPEIQVNTTEGFHETPAVTRLVDGNYVVAWRSDPAQIGGGALTFRIFDLEGTPSGGEIKPRISGFNGEMAMTLLDNGQFVIAHVRLGVVSDIGVRKSIVECTVFEANGTSTGGHFTANREVASSSERDSNSSWPAVAPLPRGRFVVAWVQKSAETFSTSPSVRARVLAASEGRIGREVQLNTTTAGTRFNVSVATMSGGEEGEAAFIAWSDDSRTGANTSDIAVRGRVIRNLP